MEYLAASQDFLGFLIEGDTFAGAGRGVGHDGRDRMLIARLDRGIRLLARAEAIEPVVHVRSGESGP